MKKVLVFTGAGLSAESGIATFRDNNGTWTKYDPNKVATFSAFQYFREETFDFYNERRLELENIQPNKAHYELAKLQKKYGKDVVKIVTQNVDDLLERAGCEEVFHVHGKLCDMKCLSCNQTWDIGYSKVNVGIECPKCKSPDTKPGVIFFGEPAPAYAKMFTIFGNRSKEDIILVIGTSGQVIPLKYIVGDSVDSYSTKILCNKDKDVFINESVFTHKFYEPITKAIDEILKIINQKMK